MLNLSNSKLMKDLLQFTIKLLPKICRLRIFTCPKVGKKGNGQRIRSLKVPDSFLTLLDLWAGDSFEVDPTKS